MRTRHSNLALIVPGTRRDLEPPAAVNRREYERLAARELAWLNLVRLKYGPAVSLLDLSSGGAQIEASGFRLRPGATVVFEIAGQDCDFAVPSAILRCQVSSIAPHITYRGALEFRRPIELPHKGPAAAGINPLLDHTRLAETLRRTGATDGAQVAFPDLTSVGAGALAAAQAVIESSACRRAEDPFSVHASRLLQAVTRSIEQGESSDAFARQVIDALCRTVSAQSIRLIDGSTPLSHPRPDTVAFDVPTMSGRSTKLLVEFPRGSRFEEWHLRLLETAAHLFTIAKDVERSPLVAATPARQSAPSTVPLGWRGVVVRYLDGRMLKGYGRDFSPQRGRFQLWSAPDCPVESRITVPLASLKAVCFVRQLDGAASQFDPAPATGTVEPGRPIIVTFVDGEVLAATTLNYTEKGPGFFVTPVDKTTNSLRIYVVSKAIARVQFP